MSDAIIITALTKQIESLSTQNESLAKELAEIKATWSPPTAPVAPEPEPTTTDHFAAHTQPLKEHLATTIAANPLSECTNPNKCTWHFCICKVPLYKKRDKGLVKDPKHPQRQWRNATNGLDPDCTIDRFYDHIRDYYTNLPLLLKTKQVNSSELRTVLNNFKLPDDTRPDGWRTWCTKCDANAKADQVCVQWPEEQIRATLTTSDGTLFTINALREWVTLSLPKTANDSHRAYRTMVLACLAFHGNRQQDWLVAYGEANKDSIPKSREKKHGVREVGYYDPSTHEVYINKGATKCENERRFELHPTVVQAVEQYHSTLPEPATFLLPGAATVADHTDHIGSILKEALREQWGIKYKRGTPHMKPINPTLLRDLWETDLRYIQKPHKDTIAAEMKKIDHTMKMSFQVYAGKLAKMVPLLAAAAAPAADDE